MSLGREGRQRRKVNALVKYFHSYVTQPFCNIPNVFAHYMLFRGKNSLCF